MNEEDKKRREVFEWRTCIEKECPKKDFYISVAEKEYFDNKGYQLPKRCYKCRVTNRGKINGSNNEKSSS